MTERLTAGQVRRMEPGTWVLLHGTDERGVAYSIHCCVVRKGGRKMLRRGLLLSLQRVTPIETGPGEYFARA